MSAINNLCGYKIDPMDSACWKIVYQYIIEFVKGCENRFLKMGDVEYGLQFDGVSVQLMVNGEECSESYFVYRMFNKAARAAKLVPILNACVYQCSTNVIDSYEDMVSMACAVNDKIYFGESWIMYNEEEDTVHAMIKGGECRLCDYYFGLQVRALIGNVRELSVDDCTDSFSRNIDVNFCYTNTSTSVGLVELYSDFCVMRWKSSKGSKDGVFNIGDYCVQVTSVKCNSALRVFKRPMEFIGVILFTNCGVKVYAGDKYNEFVDAITLLHNDIRK